MDPRTIERIAIFSTIGALVLQLSACVINDESYPSEPKPVPMPFPTRQVVNGGPVSLGGSISTPGAAAGGNSGASPVKDSEPLKLTCLIGDLSGGAIPSATRATASAFYSDYHPSDAIDHVLTYGWNAGSSKGWLKLEFPGPIKFKAVHLAAVANPATDEHYSITADGTTRVIGSAYRHVPLSSSTSPAILDPIPAGPGTHSSITITVDGKSSWVMISEVALITDECRP